MPVSYPVGLRLPVRASRTRSQPAAFAVDRPRRGPVYAHRIGTTPPVVWSMTWKLTSDEAATFLQWFTHDLDRGQAEFTLPISTEFGLANFDCLFLADELLTARQDGALWVYTARVLARAFEVPPPPSAPVIASQRATSLAFLTSWSITPPTGIAAGNLLLAMVNTFAGGRVPETTSTGWARIGSRNSALGAGMKTSLFAKIATGSDALTVNVDPLSNTWGSYLYWRITGCDDIAKVSFTSAESSTTTNTLPFSEHNPGDGSLDRLWIAAAAWAGTPGVTVSTFPAGYASTQQATAASGTSQTVTASAARDRISTSETPGNMTLSGNRASCQTWTIAVKA